MTATRVEAAWPRPTDVTDDHIEQLGTGLPGYPAVIDSGALLLYIQFDLPAGDLADTLSQAVTHARQAYARGFGEERDPVQLTVAPADPGLIPGPMDLVNTTEVGQILQVSRQRAAQLAPRLGVPLGHPGGAPVWVRRAVLHITAAWSRSSARA